MHALGPIRALRPRLHRVYAVSLVKQPRALNGPRKVSRTSRDDALILSRQISIAGARSHRPHSCVGTLLGTLHTPRSTHVTMAVQPEKSASSPKRVNGGKSPKAAKAKATTRSPTDDIEDLIEKHPALNSIKDDAPVLRDELLGWYDRVHRILPWRRNPHSQHAPPPRGPGADATPAQHWAGCHETGASMDVPPDQYAYGVWVSEIMSQQTQIERVATYWRRWIDRWPDAVSLSNATQEEVNEMWAGLGYYRRARYLLDGAKYAVANGGMPTDLKGLGDVPGVGPYTAAAVASIAFGEKTAAVDGNVIRVCTRLAAVRGAGDATKNNSDAAKAVRFAADWALSPDRPGDFNQAMMELGATVCTPKAPKCGTCPLRRQCAGFKLESEEGEEGGTFKVTDLPEREKKAGKREERVAVVVLERQTLNSTLNPESAYLLVRRPEGGLLGGLWEFPSAVTELEATSSDFYAPVDAVVDAVFNPRCGELKSRTELGEVTHTFSHVRHTYVVRHEVVVVTETEANGPERGGGEEGGCREWRWVTATELDTLGLSSGVRKIQTLIGKKEKTVKVKKGESAIGKMFAAKKAKTGE